MSEQLNCRELLHSEMCVGDRSILCFFLLAFRIVAVLPFRFRRFVVYRLSPKSAFRHSAVAILLGIFIILCQHQPKASPPGKVFGNVLRGDAAPETMQHSKSRVVPVGEWKRRMWGCDKRWEF